LACCLATICGISIRDQRKLIKWGVVLFVILIAVLSSRIKQRLWIELESNVTQNSVNYEIGTPTEKVYNVSVKDALKRDVCQKRLFSGNRISRLPTADL
jgi:hypothetical protein